MLGKSGVLKSINKKIDQIAINMEKVKLVDYVYYLEHPRRLLWVNFLGGMARGLGIAIGFTLLGALLIYFLETIVKWNLPLIGEFVSEIVKIVQQNMDKAGGKIDG